MVLEHVVMPVLEHVVMPMMIGFLVLWSLVRPVYVDLQERGASPAQLWRTKGFWPRFWLALVLAVVIAEVPVLVDMALH